MNVPEHLKSHPLFSGGKTGIMSGENPRFPAEAEATHENLLRHIKQMGLKHEDTHGKYGDHEPSVIIHGPTREQMHELGKKFGQESVIFSDKGVHHLQYTNGPHEGKVLGTEAGKEPLEFFNEAPDDYYTKLKDGGHFRINFDFSKDPQPLDPVQKGLQKAEPWVSYGAANTQGSQVYKVGDRLPALLAAAKQHGIEVKQHGEPAPGVVVVPPQPDLSLPEHREQLATSILHGVADELARPAARACYGDDAPQQQALRLAWDAGHHRRNLAHKIGLPVSDTDFRRDLNAGVAHALSKLTGGQLPPGFGAAGHHIPLSVAMDHLRELSQVRKHEHVILSDTRSPAVANQDEKMLTIIEAAEVLKKSAQDKIKVFEAEIKEFRARELKKALVPPHKHTQAMSVGAGVEDVPAGKLKQAEAMAFPAKPMPFGNGIKAGSGTPAGVMKDEESEGSSSEESSMDKAELCKQCGQGHGLDKACMTKAMLSDSKGKVTDNGIHPDAKLPSDKKEETVEASGSGGQIKTAKSLKSMQKAAMAMTKRDNSPSHSSPGPSDSDPNESSPSGEKEHHEYKPDEGLGHSRGVSGGVVSCRHCGRSRGHISHNVEKAEPPMAKPPGGKNMATHIPASKPMAPPAMKAEGEVASGVTGSIPSARMDAVAKSVGKVIVPKSSKPQLPKVGSKDRDYDVRTTSTSTEYIKKAGLGMAAAAQRADPLSHSYTDAQAAKAPAPAPKPMPSPSEHSARAAGFAEGLGQPSFQPSRPGIFGRMDSKMKKDEPSPGKVNISPTLVAPPTLKPGYKMGVASDRASSPSVPSVTTKLDRPKK
jgi:hypothetical protein